MVWESERLGYRFSDPIDPDAAIAAELHQFLVAHLEDSPVLLPTSLELLGLTRLPQVADALASCLRPISFASRVTTGTGSNGGYLSRLF